VERLQLTWLVWAVALFAVLNSQRWITGNGPILLLLTLPLVPAAAAVAILRYDLYDIRVIVNRTLVYGLLTALLGLSYAGAVLVLGQLAGRERNSLAVAGATLAVAAVFQPARRRIQRAVDRRFNRRRYDAAQTIQAFSTRLREEVDLDTLTTELCAVTNKTMEPSSSSALSCGVEMLELDAGVLGGEPPVDSATGAVARRLPGCDLPLQGRPVGQPSVQALSGQHGQLDLGHVQPAAVLGGGVQLQLVGQPLGLGRWERRIQRRRRVGVEVVLDQQDPLSIGVVDIDQVLDGSAPSRSGCAGR